MAAHRPIGARTGIKGDQLEQVFADVVTAGLVERHVYEPGLVILASKGWRSTGTMRCSCWNATFQALPLLPPSHDSTSHNLS